MSAARFGFGIAALVTVAFGAGAAPAASAAPGSERSEACSAFLAEELGDQGMTITTESPAAQRLFNQGLTLGYAFNHDEAARSFRAALAEDPSCAMCSWGLALVMGPNINARMSAESGPIAYRTVQQAMALRGHASERERAYIEALARRYAAEPVDDRSKLDRDYADAMREVARRFPRDLDAAALYAEALMDTSPWDYWGEGGRPPALTTELLGTLERVLAVAPDHIGANHFYIHVVEAVRPRLGLASADRLGALAPGAGHLVHMSSHIYLRLGRYHDASAANERAVAADRRYVESCHPGGFYATMYVPHNVAFLVATRSLEGRSAEALEAARDVASLVAPSLAMEGHGADAEQLYATPWLVMVRFGRWAEILAAPAPPPERVYAAALWRYARSIASSRTSRLEDAAADLEALRAAAADPSIHGRMLMGVNRAESVLAVAVAEASGELAAARGDYDAAIVHLTDAVERQDGLRYMEPPPWHHSVRIVLGSALLDAGRPEEAERVFREDLERLPENGWALFGLGESLVRQHRDAEAGIVRRRFAEAWRHADVGLESLMGCLAARGGQ